MDRMPALALRLGITLAVIAFAVAAPRRFASAQSTLYEVDPAGSAYSLGCLPPCLCPILLLGEVNGSFQLVPAGTDGDFDLYDVLDVQLTALSLAGGVVELGGAGEYRVDVDAGVHEMNLSLDDGAGLLEMMSGEVPFADGIEFPELSIFVSTSLFCYGNHLQLRASPAATADFIRGDLNADATVDIADAVAALGFLFVSGAPDCTAAGDANDDEVFDISDPVYLLSSLFAFGDPPPAPYPDCGADPTPPGLDCFAPSCP